MRFRVKLADTERPVKLSPYQVLANAIILQAVRDYRLAKEKLAEDPKDKEKRKAARSTIRKVEQFFRSKWFQQLTDLDGEDLLSKLKEE